MNGAIESSIKAEVAHIGRNHLHITTVVATHGNGMPAVACFGDIDRPMVVTADVRTHQTAIDIDLRLLACPLELQQGMPAGIGIRDLDGGAIPGSTLIVVHVGIDTIFGIIAMGKRDVLPQRDAFGFPFLHGTLHLPDVCHVGANELPLGQINLCASCHSQHTGRKTKHTQSFQLTINN